MDELVSVAIADLTSFNEVSDEIVVFDCGGVLESESGCGDLAFAVEDDVLDVLLSADAVELAAVSFYADFDEHGHSVVKA